MFCMFMDLVHVLLLLPPYESLKRKCASQLGYISPNWKFEKKKKKIVNPRRVTFLLLSMTSCKTSHSRASSVSMSGSEMFKVEISSPPVTSVEELVPVSGSAKSSTTRVSTDFTFKKWRLYSCTTPSCPCVKHLLKILAQLLLSTIFWKEKNPCTIAPCP